MGGTRLQPKTLKKLKDLQEKVNNWVLIYPEKDFPIYKGNLDRKKMPEVVRFAYESFCNQKKKCNNKNDRWYLNYGAKGIKVEYSVREFIGWYLYCKAITDCKISTVYRLDHSKGYNFNNIMMADSSENSLEAFIRNKLYIQDDVCREVVALDKKTGNIVLQFPSIREAARQLNCSQRLIQFLIRGVYKKSKKIPYILKYKHGLGVNNDKTINCNGVHSKK